MRGENPTGIYRFGERVVKSFPVNNELCDVSSHSTVTSIRLSPLALFQENFLGKLVREDGKFIGAVAFGGGLLGPKSIVYGSVDKFKVAEIVRIALREHQYEVSRMISIAIKLLLKRCPGIELIVAFADRAENHHGGITKRSISPTRE